jgi:nitrate/TMAO reductase-like tetraheme cytochrome c subunit
MRNLLLAAAIVVSQPAVAFAQANRCVACHFANLGRVPAPERLAHWEQSAHARHGIGCDACHGGDPATYQPIDAHRGVLNSRQPSSTVNRANLALTCAPCHGAVVAAFKQSRHAARLAATGSSPNCADCHRAMEAEPSPASRIETTCARCHLAETALTEAPALIRARVAALDRIGETLARVESSISWTTDRAKRNRLAAELLLARASLQTATDAVHTFDLKVIDDQRAAAQRRANELVAELVKP